MTSPDPRPRWIRRLTTGTTTTAGLILLGAPVVAGHDALPDPAPTPGGHDPGASEAPGLVEEPLRLVGHRKPHPHRNIKLYRVRRGDTPSGLAVRYHAWTAQLIRMNHTSTLYVGQVIRIPVVPRAVKACTKHRHHHIKPRAGKHSHSKPSADRPGKKHDRAGPGKAHAKKKHHAKPHKKKHAPKKAHRSRWQHADASRATVRRVVIRTANRHGVNPNLALAISWQEAGWQQRRVSPAGALGAMQVMPGTGKWMSQVVGRRLNLRNLHDNVTAGVVLIKILRSEAKLKYAVAGYYQGLAGVRRHGMYPSTKRYVANVLALKKRLAHGWNPA